MSQKIHQMQITFVPSQDRRMFRVKTTDQTELKRWFTRRYVKLLWQVLQKMLGKTQSGMSADPRTRQAVLSFQHEKAVSGMDFATPYQESTEANRPLGDEPVLVTRIQVKPGPGKAQVLCLHPDQGQGLEIALDPPWIHSFCKLLAQGVKKTDWDLDYRIADTAAPISETTH
ncbi:MAG: hypothetical protein JRJ82_13810 [Deltaproteobacteria bacterium]|nr:hypothetical protein [Deltaproteobacteria bacterium]